MGWITDILIVVAVTLMITVVMGLYTSIRPSKYISSLTPRSFGLAYEPVEFSTADGISIAGWFVPRRSGPADSSIIVLHGYPADKGDILSRAVPLADNHNLLLIDFRYFGQSGGNYTTVGSRETEELAAAVRYLSGRGQAKIGVYGFSMGGAVALMYAGREPAVAAIAAEASYADLDAMVGEQYRRFGPLQPVLAAATGLLARIVFGVDVKATSPAAAVSGTDLPILLIHSRNDQVITFQNAEAIRRSLSDNPNAEFWFPDEGGHGAPQREFDRIVGGFFARHLGE